MWGQLYREFIFATAFNFGHRFFISSLNYFFAVRQVHRRPSHLAVAAVHPEANAADGEPGQPQRVPVRGGVHQAGGEL